MQVTPRDIIRGQDWDPAAHPVKPLDPNSRQGKHKPKPKVEKPPAPPKPEAPRNLGGRPPKHPILAPIDRTLNMEEAVLTAAYNVQQGLEGSGGRIIEAILSSLPEMHDIQRRIVESPAKRKVINCGRRVGKTTVLAREAIVQLCNGRRVLIASTTQEQADAAWEKITTWLEPFFAAGYIEKNESRRVITFPETGGRIRCKTARDEDTLRGDYADFLFLDECALLAEKAWTEVGAPMLLDNNGDCWFLSTPRRRNWFHGLYVKAVADEGGRWGYFHATSHDNPHLSVEALKEITADLTEEGYKQEIMAEFLEGEGAVFRNISKCLTAPMPTLPDIHRDHRVVAGIDWGRIKDSTVIDIFCATCMQELFMDRFNQIEWKLQRSRLVNDYHTWFVSYVLAENNSMGAPNLEALRNEDRLEIEGFETQTASKAELVQTFSLALERESIKLQPISIATAELEAFEGKTSPRTNITTYEAPTGVHDDTVMARMLSLRAALTGMGASAPQAVSYSDIEQFASVVEAGGGLYDDWDNDFAAASGGSGYVDVSHHPALAPPAGRPW